MILRTTQPRIPARGFTLIELMVSLAIVVMLLIGVNVVFNTTSRAVGQGQAYSAMVRDGRSAQMVMEQDARQWAADAPLFIIRNESRTLADGRTARRDYVAFPARGLYRRQTGDINSFTSGTTSFEAWVWYGITDPVANGDTRSILGRVAILLKDPNTFTEARLPGIYSTASASDSRKNWQVRESRFDIAGTTLEQIRTEVRNAARANPNNWWNPYIYRFQCNPRLAKPLSLPDGPGKVAQATPAFVENCSEFIVEYAGDFLSQSSDGKITAPTPDGTMDFVMRNPGAPGESRQTRWYGMWRDMDANGKVDFNDVQPVHMTAGINPFFAHERERSQTTYTCIWQDSAPKLIRVSIKVDDPSGNLQEGPWFEFILGPR